MNQIQTRILDYLRKNQHTYIHYSAETKGYSIYGFKGNVSKLSAWNLTKQGLVFPFFSKSGVLQGFHLVPTDKPAKRHTVRSKNRGARRKRRRKARGW